MGVVDIDASRILQKNHLPRAVHMSKSKKAGKTLAYTKDQTPLLPLSGTRKVVRTPTNPFETVDNAEVHLQKKLCVCFIVT